MRRAARWSRVSSITDPNRTEPSANRLFIRFGLFRMICLFVCSISHLISQMLNNPANPIGFNSIIRHIVQAFIHLFIQHSHPIHPSIPSHPMHPSHLSNPPSIHPNPSIPSTIHPSVQPSQQLQLPNIICTCIQIPHHHHSRIPNPLIHIHIAITLASGKQTTAAPLPPLPRGGRGMKPLTDACAYARTQSWGE